MYFNIPNFFIEKTFGATKALKLLLVLFLLAISLLPSYSQNQKQWLKYADKSFEEKDFYGASLYYRKAMLLDSSNLYVVYNYAESLRLYNEYNLAERYYKYVYSRDNKKQFPESLFWWALMQKFNAKYEEARKNFTRFAGYYKKKDSYYYKKAKQEVKSCEFAQKLMADTVPVKVFNMGEKVNTTNSEFNPLLLNDTTLIFSSSRTEKVKEFKVGKEPKDFIRMYIATKQNGSWELEREVDSTINQEGFHSANGSFDHEKKNFYFTLCDNDNKCAIFVSPYINNQWQSPQKLNAEINFEGYSATQPFLANINNKEILFWVSDRPGGKGRLDIWYSIKENGNFGKAINAGEAINTPDDEVSPWFDPKSKLFYFSSSWHYGLGGQDIFRTSDAPKFSSTPDNLGYPINTSVNEIYYSISPTHEYAFITSNRKGSITAKGETCCNDIWLIEYEKKKTEDSTKFKTLADLNNFLPVTLYFHNDEPDPRTTDTTTKLNYLQTYESYNSLKEIYKNEYSKGMPKEEKVKAEEAIQNFFEDKVDKGVEDLELYADLLLKHLEKGQRIEVTVKGYASPLAKTDYNVHLTLRRISSMENFLRSYKNNAYVPYLEDTAKNGGSLKIIRVPFGEYKALEAVNDNFQDQQNSVYSISAALERKIEIVKASLAHKDSLFAEISFQKEIKDFGKVSAGQKLSHVFTVKNTGNVPLLLYDITDSCGCIQSKIIEKEIKPGKETTIEVIFDTSSFKGKQAKHIIVNSNASNPHKELTLTAEVETGEDN